MKSPCADPPRFTLFLASFILAAVFPVAAFAQDSSPNPSTQKQHHSFRSTQGPVKYVVGTICKGENGEFLLRDDSKGLYWLDDQSLARKFTGKPVIVTGFLDAAENLIRILKIQSAT